MVDYWYKQEDNPLFPGILWSRPENKRQAGKLLIIGGNVHSMTQPGLAYTSAHHAGIGTVKVLLPDALAKTVGTHLPDVYLAPSNRSGSFNTKALAEWLDFSMWADAVLLAGDTAHNSETAIVIERFLEKYSGIVVITRDCLDQFILQAKTVLKRPDTLIIASFPQLQKMIANISLDASRIIKHSNPLLKNVEVIANVSEQYPAYLCTRQGDEVVLGIAGQISSTTFDQSTWQIQAASYAAVWWLQNPEKPFEAITTAFFEIPTKNPSY